jgi:hypothetical protein
MLGTENYTNGTASSPFNNKLRLIRFRRAKEHLKFWQEIRLVPRWMFYFTIIGWLIAEVGAQIGISLEGSPWEELSVETSRLVMIPMVILVSIILAGLLFLIGYVNRDAKRRGMNSNLWTLLVIVLLPAYLATGFIIYFWLREPLPYDCPNCGKTVSARFNFCPACQFNLRPSCSQCRREVRLDDRYCPYCANELAQVTGEVPTA